MPKINYIQFYADKMNCYSNKLFSFPVENVKSAFRILLHFKCANNSFRSIYLKTVDNPRVLEYETQIELTKYTEFFKTYDTSNYPTLEQAWNDFQIFKM
jgi:hypothetical protein